MLAQIGTDLQEAVQELRNLAHGIYPPLLMDRGLTEALSAAAGRAALPTDVEADGIGRYPQAVEAAVYFCCLEALQNAASTPGDGAQATITVREDEGALLVRGARRRRRVRPRPARARDGHGFVNMSDRVGAIGGTHRRSSRRPGRAPRSGAGSRWSTDRLATAAVAVGGAAASLPDVADDGGAELLLVDVLRRAARRRRRPGGRRPGRSRAASPRRSGCAAVMRRVASMPLIPGRLMSMRTSPGASASAMLDGLLAALGLADHLEPGRRGHHRARGPAERAPDRRRSGRGPVGHGIHCHTSARDRGRVRTPPARGEGRPSPVDRSPSGRLARQRSAR